MTGVRTISPFDRILYLKSLPAIAELTSAQVMRMASEAREVRFEAGERLLEPGQPAHCFYALASGSVDLTRNGHSLVVHAPEFLGLANVLAADTHSSAVARSEVVALRFESTGLLEIFEEDFELLQNSIRQIARYHMALLRRVIGGTRRSSWEPLVEIPEDRELDLLERLIMIRQGDLFASVGLEAGVMLATSMKQLHWPAGKTIWKPGETSGATYLIVSGIVDAYLENGDAFEAGPGYPVGNIESLAGAPRWYTVVPRTDTVVFRADHETFFDVMEDDFEVAEAFLEAMSRGILLATDALLERNEPLPSPDHA